MSARNYQALAMTVTPEMRQQYIDSLNPKPAGTLGPRGIKIMIQLGVVLIIVGLLAFFLIFMTDGSPWSTMAFVFSLMLGIIFTVVGYFSRKELDLNVKLTRFAQDNNLTYAISQANPAYSGMIFGLGHSRKSTNMLRSMTPVPYEIGEYTYTVGSGKNRHTYFFGYVGIALPRRLPHMVLDATKNNAKFFGKRMSNLPVTYDKNQTLSLEGDFNNYFTLYAPKDYERDALYIFSPDVMALMIDNVHTSADTPTDKKKKHLSFDAEIVDNRLFIYNTTKTKMDDPEVLERFFKIIDTIGAKMHDQSKMYADEKVGNFAADTIAQGGVRLKRNAPIAIIVIFVIFVLLSNISSIINAVVEMLQ